MARYCFWGFQVEIEERITKEWYARAEMWDCDCGDCRNFLEIAKEGRLPVPVMETLSDLGIPPEKATYVCNLYSDGEGFHYQFSYRIAGHILNEGRIGTVSQAWGAMDCGHEVYPYGAPDFPLPHFDLEFYVVLPWVLEEPSGGR
ncbi:MAG: hypothetical protein PHD32_02785 [Eubacteriales bacterium]|nr:hypothetical protein [Eubacteriales bacterium]